MDMLPKFSKGSTGDPIKLLLFSSTKVGKTTLASGLPNALIIDTENGSRFVDGIKFNLLEESKKQKTPPLKLLRLLAQEIERQNLEQGKPVYDFIVIDTLTALEQMAHTMATVLYKQTNVGKNFKGEDVVSALPKGGGYLWLRKAFNTLISYFDGLAGKSLILLGHIKQSSILKDGKELSAMDLDLTGKIKQIVSADVDAIGLLRRNKENTNEVIVSFKTNERDLATGSRLPHLRNKEFVLSEYDEKKNKFAFHWDEIYKSLKKGK